MTARNAETKEPDGTGVWHDGRELTQAEVDDVEAQFRAAARQHEPKTNDQELD